MYAVRRIVMRRLHFARFGSVLILIAPVMILIGFDREASRTDFERPFVGLAIYACFAGVLLHAIARRAHHTHERRAISGN